MLLLIPLNYCSRYKPEYRKIFYNDAEDDVNSMAYALRFFKRKDNQIRNFTCVN